jgi:hypothetical protein
MREMPAYAIDILGTMKIHKEYLFSLVRGVCREVSTLFVDSKE